MKKIFCLVVLILVSVNFSYSQKLVELKPTKKKQPVKLLFGNIRTYYHVDKQHGINFTVENIDKVIIYSRKRIDNNNLSDYSIRCTFDDSKSIQYVSLKIEEDKVSTYFDKSKLKKVSKSYKKVLKIPINTKNLNISSKVFTDEIDVIVVGYIGSKKEQLKPIDVAVNRIKIKSGEVLNYYNLNSKISTQIDLEKSGQLIVYSRKRIGKKSTDEYSYSYRMNNSKIEQVMVKGIKIAQDAVYKSFNVAQTPSNFKKTLININDAPQQFVFSSRFPVDARFLFLEKKEEPDWKELKNGKNQILLKSRNKNTIRLYHRIDGDKSFDFSINAAEDMKLKVLVRGEFTYDMHANNDYEVGLVDNGKRIKTFRLSCNRSSVMTYKNNDDLIIGTLDKFYIDVPKGKHNYKFIMPNKNKSALIRVFYSKN